MTRTPLSTATDTRPAPQRDRAGSLPIGDYAMLSDCSSAALVGADGSIDWLCLPRFDSPAIFSRLLDPDAGHWSIAPAGPFSVSRRYLPGTLVLETTFTTPGGAVRLVDALAFAPGQRGHDLGVDAPHELLRLVEGLSCSVRPCARRSPSRRERASASRCAGPGPRRRSPSRLRRPTSARASRTSRRAGAPGRPSTTSTRARTATSCASAHAS